VASEKRTRVEIFLPVRTDTAIYRIVTDWLSDELALARGGSTLTTPFTGLYASTNMGRGVVRDQIQILFCDFDLDTDNPAHLGILPSYLNDLRLILMEILHEEDVWIIHHSITRIL